MKRILCLWFPHWPIQRFLAARPELQGQPVVLYGRDPRRGQCVRAYSREAYECGVRDQMPLTEATALLRQSGRRPSALHIEPYRPDADTMQLQQVAEWCERFSPIVGMETAAGKPSREFRHPGAASGNEDTHPECLLLDVAGLGPLFGGERALAETLRHELAGQGYQCCLAIADTIGAAWAVAHSLTLAEVVVVPPGESPVAVAQLPIDVLRLPDEAVTWLNSLGVERIDQLCRLPRAGLAERFGQGLLRKVDQATAGATPGGATEVIVSHRPTPVFFVEHIWEYPVERLEDVERASAELLQCLTNQLRRQQQGVLRLHCRLDVAAGESPGGEPLCFRVDLFRPTATVGHLLDLVRMQLEQRTLPGPIGRIRMQAELTSPLIQQQGELFPTEEPLQELACLIDRLGTRLGSDGVVRPCLYADAQPERAFRYLPVGDPSAFAAKLPATRNAATRNAPTRNKKGSSSQGSSSQAHPSPGTGESNRVAHLRPLYLFAEPVPVEVLSVVPNGPPVRWRWKGGEHRVLEHWGPERIETGWWRGRSVCRDYYRVQSERGTRFWLFLKRDEGRWFLQGAFD